MKPMHQTVHADESAPLACNVQMETLIPEESTRKACSCGDMGVETSRLYNLINEQTLTVVLSRSIWLQNLYRTPEV